MLGGDTQKGQGQPSALLPKQRLVGYGSQSSPRVHALPPAEHYAEPRKSLEDERHQARGLVVSLNGRLEKMRDAAKMARAPTRSTNATINGMYDVTVDSRKRSTKLNRRKLRFADGARGVALAVRCSQGTTYGKHGRLLRAEKPQSFPPARHRRLRGLLLPHGRRTPPVPTLPLSVDKTFCRIRCAPPSSAPPLG